jgi:small subunit ribosomal protein S18
VCAFCDDKSLTINYKKANALQNYLTDRGKILPRRATGSCAKHQRLLAVAIKRARHLAMLPFTTDQTRSG